MPAFCRIEMLGGLRVHIAGRTITRFQTRKTGALLAYLALHPSRPHSREALAEILWPGADPTAARNRLNQAVSSLRRQVHPPGVEAGFVIGADAQNLWINSAGVKTDVDQFKKLLQNVSAASPASLIEAADLYQGELLAGLYEDWLVPERLNLSEMYFKCIKYLSSALSAEGRAEEALSYVAAAIVHDPLDADLRTLSMDLHILAGRPAIALREFENYEKALAREDEAVAQNVIRAYDRARSSLSSPFGVSAAPWATPNPSADADLQGGSPAANRLPRALTAPRYFTEFFGREEELQRVLNWSADENAGMLTLLGAGGCGKTRLASRAAFTLAERGQNVFWVNLASVDSASQIVSEVARVVCGPSTQGDLLAQLREALARQLGVVLFLDNLEHLADKASETCIELLELLRDGRIVATSRRRVGIDAECILPIMPLPIPEHAPLGMLPQNPSIALFVHRAQRVKPDFQLTERTAHSIVSLCQKLEGLPLALELAASWARTLSPSQMLDRVSDRMGFLATNRRDIAERHRSIRATIDASFDLLSPAGRELFKRTSVFRSGWSLAAARAIAPAIDVEAAIEELVDCSIAITAESNDEVRFFILDTLSEYSARILSPDERAEVAELHAQFFLQFTRDAERLSSGLGARKLDPDYPNVILALRHFIEVENWTCALELGELLGGYWEFRGRLEEGLEYLLGLERCEVSENDVMLAQVRTRIATLAWEQGMFDLARNAISAAIESLRKSGRDELVANALFQLQKEEHRAGRYDECRTLLGEAIAIGKKLKSPSILATALRRTGNASIELHEFDRALREYEDGLSIARESGQADLIGPALTNLAYLGCFMGKLEAARTWLDEADKLNLATGRSDVILDCRVNRIHLERLSGNFEMAFRTASDLFQKEFEGWTSKWEPIAAVGLLCENAGMHADAASLLGFALHELEKHYADHEHLMLREVRRHLERCADALGDRRYKDRLSQGRTMDLEAAKKMAKSLSFRAVKSG